MASEMAVAPEVAVANNFVQAGRPALDANAAAASNAIAALMSKEEMIAWVNAHGVDGEIVYLIAQLEQEGVYFDGVTKYWCWVAWRYPNKPYSDSV